MCRVKAVHFAAAAINLYKLRRPAGGRVKGDPSCPHSLTLYLVGTPIGNLEDISLRALRILKEVELIACEDTRQTPKLLNHYGIKDAHHQLSRAQRADPPAELIMHLEQGQSIALVTDAGMPGISDPGYRLVSLAIRHRIPVVPGARRLGFSLAPWWPAACPPIPSASTDFCRPSWPAAQGAGGAFRNSHAHARSSTKLRIACSAALEDFVDVLGAHRHVVVAREVTKIPRRVCARHRRRGPRRLHKARRDSRRNHPAHRPRRGGQGLPAVAQKNARTRVRELMQPERSTKKRP